IQEVLEAFAPWRRSHRRDAWRPLTEDRPGAAADPRFGGVPLLRSGEPWPACSGCRRPMPLFLQLDLASLPESCPFRGHGFLQLFYCVSDLPPSVPCECDLQAWQPLSPGKLARAIEPGAGDFAEPTLPSGFTPFPSRIIVGWERFDDYPSAAE